MREQTTSLARANSLRGEWARFGAFAKYPKLPERPEGPGRHSLAAVLRLYALDVVLMLILASIAAIVLWTGYEMPETELAGMDMTPQLIALVILAGPLMEEIGFRSWLSGRPGQILALLAIGAGLFVLNTDITRTDAGMNWKAISVAGGSVLVAILALWALRHRGPMRWFAWIFPLFYALSTISFALIHGLNYDEGIAMATLPLVLPQFFAGAIFGYARVTYGLWASVLLHILHNAGFIGLVLLATKAAG